MHVDGYPCSVRVDLMHLTGHCFPKQDIVLDTFERLRLETVWSDVVALRLESEMYNRLEN